MARARTRSFWTLGRTEVRGHAVVLALVLWGGAAALLFGQPGRVDVLGQLKGPDFVHFYTLGRAAVLGESDALYNRSALHALQTQLVPESESLLFEPVYPPQAAVLFAPFARLPYGAALALWVWLTGLVYVASVWAARRRWRQAVPDRFLIAAAALGFPPFWSLVLHGQTTAVPMLGFLLGWMAFERGRLFLAGLALGLLALKPQFGLVLAVVVLGRREWGMLGGALVSAVLQAALVGVSLGGAVLGDYLELLTRLPQVSASLEPRPYQMHSIGAVTGLLPGGLATAAWLVGSGVVVWWTVRVWGTGAPRAVRFGVMVIASVLVSPHLTIYDAAVLAMPLLLIGGWLETRAMEPARAQFRAAAYWLFVSLIVPVALLIYVQVSVFVLAWLFWIAAREALRTENQPAPGQREAATAGL